MEPIREPNPSEHPDGEVRPNDPTTEDPAAEEPTTGHPTAEELAAEELARIAAEAEVWEGPVREDPVPPGERKRRMSALVARLGGHRPDPDSAQPDIAGPDSTRPGGTGLATRLGGGLLRGGRRLGTGARSGAGVLADRLLDAAPRIPVRDLATLRDQHPGARTPDELADLIVSGAVKASAAVGASTGAVAMLPVPPALAVEMGAELLAIAAIELKLIAELYTIYGQAPTGSIRQRSQSYLAAWSEGRGLDLTRPGTLVVLSKGAGLRRQVSKRLTRAGLRKLPTLTPLLVGAVIGARINRADTFRLALAVRRDLQERRPIDPGYWDRPGD
ncbi:hypothetical protein K353_00398 [Kitasatospora sp. SolWspMP-SS2h]|uniref:hypothetical protein n=1 Tax=Kitasatospora sp. SolWspMP-SS2h TaxID=1305729 RepID=UPI000DB9CC0E|nr:hypothetical protein [Kitasatospora sp. SolWspMP-SS2h]RAJ47197.1 hypothetical protein K353_00398 [Kitasatospora sp. SolWspMP-SS2h]